MITLTVQQKRFILQQKGWTMQRRRRSSPTQRWSHAESGHKKLSLAGAWIVHCKHTAIELRDAIKNYLKVRDNEGHMRKEYSPGTVNAEDAWRDYGTEVTESNNRLKKALKNFRV